MIKPFEFYFDFGSPYTFLAHKQIRKIEKENSIKIKYMPILLGGLLKLADIKANVDIPIKGKYMIRDCKLWAAKHNIIFKFNNYFPIITLNLMRSVLVAEKKGFSENYINRIFDAIWVEDLNLNDNITVEKILKSLTINPKKFLTEIEDKKIIEDLKFRTEEALEKAIKLLTLEVDENQLCLVDL